MNEISKLRWGFLCMGWWACPVLPLPAQDAPPDFVVAPNGDDSNPGTLEKPLATLDRARAVVRELKAVGERDHPIVVAVRGGTYFLQQTLAFEPADSGTESVPVIYAAWRDEKPVISGGVPVTWTVDGGLWQASLPETKGGGWSFNRLFVNHEPRTRPRLPKEGYYYVRAEMEPTEANREKGYDRFAFSPGDFDATWHQPGDVEALCMQVWTMARMRVAAVDREDSTVTFTGPTAGLPYYQKIRQGARYLIENVREAMAPGNFYLDSESGLLTYQPLPGEQPATGIAPRLERLVEFRGNPESRAWVSHISLRGLEFSHSNWRTPPQGYAFPQAEIDLGAAISAVGARFVSLENCTISHTGGYALELGRGSKSNRITNCTLTDLGAGGIKLGTSQPFDDDELVASHNVVSDCLLAHGGRIHPAGVGIWIGQSPFNRIEHNEITDFYYTGINCGWTWGYNRSLAYQNRISYNHIHQIGQGVLSDMGGIYTLGPGMGNRLDHNKIHDIDSFGYGGWGIYFDEGTTGMLAEKNLVYRTKSAGFHQHYGRHNSVQNNIFAFGREAQWMRTKPEPDHFTLLFDHNIVIWAQAPLFGSDWSGDNFHFDSNLYWRTDGQPILFPAALGLSGWQYLGNDAHSLVADPKFVDLAHDDFRLQVDSPALAMGFQGFDPDLVGRQGAEPYVGTMPRAFPPPPPAPPPAPIHETFELVQTGSKVPAAITHEDHPQAEARITNTIARSGRQSLLFTDVAGGQAVYNPHVVWQPRMRSGVAKSSFWLRFDAGSIVVHEWRDGNQPYRIGPSLTIDAAGNLNAGGEVIAPLPKQEWIHFEITIALGDVAKGTWELTVTEPGKPPFRKKLPCNPEFRSLEWFGFISNANEIASWQLDDLDLGFKK